MGADGGRRHDERAAGTDDESGGDGGATHGRHSGELEGWINNVGFGGSQQLVFVDQAQGARIPIQGVSDRDALLCRRPVGCALL